MNAKFSIYEVEASLRSEQAMRRSNAPAFQRPSAQVAKLLLEDIEGLRALELLDFGLRRATTVASAVWGKLAAMDGLPIAYFAAAAGLVLGIPLTWRWKLQTGVGIDFSPATHWRAPTATRKVENNQGPVLVVAEYRIDPKNRTECLSAVDELGHARRRDGAYGRGVYEDVADVGRFVETYTIDSWLELMHQRERVTNADEMLENRVRHLLTEAAARHIRPQRNSAAVRTPRTDRRGGAAHRRNERRADSASGKTSRLPACRYSGSAAR